MIYYDEIAEGYEELHREEQEKKIACIQKELLSLGWKIGKKETVLDVGCGTGITTVPWPGKKTGIDPAKKLLAKAKENYPQIRFEKGEAEHLPFKDASFDWVFSVTTLQNFHDVDAALNEMKRIGKQYFVLSFLKKSPKGEEMSASIKKKFQVVQEVEEEKDWIFFLESK